MAKQSPADRLFRLSEGRCPVHGYWMPQVDGWYYSDTGERYYWPEDAEDMGMYTIVGCPRKDCGIQAIAFSLDGPWELLEEWEHLVKDPTGKVIPFPKGKKKAS